jgi:hypothetical protein
VGLEESNDNMLFDAADDGHDRMPSVDNDWPTDVDTFSSSLDDPSSFPNPFHDFTFDPLSFLRLLLFLPWCIAVGGTILFSVFYISLTDRIPPIIPPLCADGDSPLRVLCAHGRTLGYSLGYSAHASCGRDGGGAGRLAGVVLAWSDG